MNQNGKSPGRLRHQAIAFALIAVLALPFLHFLGRFSYDFTFFLRPQKTPADALIIFLDDDCRKHLGMQPDGPWDRALYHRLVEKLFAAGAAGVVFDVLFDEPWPKKEVDEQFAKVIAKTNVVLAASIRYSGGAGELFLGRVLSPAEPLESAATWGLVEIPTDNDGFVRQHYYNPRYTNLAWQVATVLGKAPLDRAKERWFNYYGGPEIFSHKSICSALEGLPPEAISNRIVFIGKAPDITYQGSQGGDEYPTPYKHWTGINSTGVELQATACLNLLHRDWLTRLPWFAEAGIVVTLAAASGFLLPLIRRRTGITVSILAAFAALAAGVFSAQYLHSWFCWAAISFVEAPAALVWVLISSKVLQPVAQSQAAPSPSPQGQGGTIVLPADAFGPAEAPPAIPDHEMIRQFGRGGFGRVWLARSTTRAYRAVKIVTRKEFTSEGPYEHEFRGILAFEPISRSHEGFVDILHVGRRDDQRFFYYVMELADDINTGRQIDPQTYTAKTLSGEIQRRGRLPFQECVKVGRSLADALHELHKAGLIHRDIKPANIIFVDGAPKLADIGAVTRTEEARTMVGTPGFMAPEGPGTPQADLFSLGKVFYEMAMGRDRYEFPGQPASLADDPERVQLTALFRIAQRACEPDPARRYASALQIRTDLEELARLFPTTPERIAD